MDTNTSTICAISTPYGTGGIAVVRLSGPQAIEITDRLFHGKKKLADGASHTAHFGQIERAGTVLDEVVVTLFRAPHSFTGEEVVEIACHGSLYVQQELLRWLVEEGCTMATRGEFTKRAFLNGKMDLTQAEAVADLIAADSERAHQVALQHLKGGISSHLEALREQLLHFTSLIELELDFADHEDIEFVDRSELEALAQTIEQHLQTLCQTFRLGNALKNGVPVAIVGPTNAGKSTLLNALVGEERAIVSAIPGTTRDRIEEQLNVQGVAFRLIDTAGIRRTEDTIESLGIARSMEAVEKAEVVLLVLDGSQKQPEALLPKELQGLLQQKKVIVLLNKMDLLLAQTDESNSGHDWGFEPKKVLPISAAHKHLEGLEEALLEQVETLPTDGVVITNLRHYEALKQALQAIQAVQIGLQERVSGEFLSLDLQDCLTALGSITGAITSQTVLNNIFAHFCIGK